ncbi:murein transglycosylase A [Thermodesulfobacteriota bacterium]
MKIHKNFLAILSVWGWLFVMVGCTIPPKEPAPTRETALHQLSYLTLPKFNDDMAYDGLEHSILKSLSYLDGIPADRMFQFGKDAYTAAHMKKTLDHFLGFIQTKPSKKELKKFIGTHYRVYTSAGQHNPGEVLFTGYFEPVLEGSRSKSTQYKFPVYARPADLMIIDLAQFSPKFKGEKIIARYTNRNIVPYHDRRAIENELILQGKAQEIAWLKNRLDLFFLQIQGSGKIYFNTGQVINVHYHASNGRPYRSIGKLLIDEGKIPREEMSMQSIRNYLDNHPEELKRILNYNPSYVFFKTEVEGPLGYIGVKLTPGRSIATDRRLFPQTALCFIETRKPLINGDGRIHQWINFSRFVLNQDTGGAIRGPGRADLFWGNGRYAEIAAGHMQHPGKLYFLVLKPVS